MERFPAWAVRIALVAFGLIGSALLSLSLWTMNGFLGRLSAEETRGAQLEKGFEQVSRDIAVIKKIVTLLAEKANIVVP